MSSFSGRHYPKFIILQAVKRIYITHPLGTLWALKNKCADIDVLIVINGFYLFKHFTDERSLQAMRFVLTVSQMKTACVVFDAQNSKQITWHILYGHITKNQETRGMHV